MTNRLYASRIPWLAVTPLFCLTLAIANRNPEPDEPFQWKPALRQSALFLGIQHGFRFATEPGARAEMKGPFLRDYVRSVRGLRGWDDGDPFLVN